MTSLSKLLFFRGLDFNQEKDTIKTSTKLTLKSSICLYFKNLTLTFYDLEIGIWLQLKSKPQCWQ